MKTKLPNFNTVEDFAEFLKEHLNISIDKSYNSNFQETIEVSLKFDNYILSSSEITIE